MIDYRLANVLLSDGTRSVDNPDLYLRLSTRPPVMRDGSVRLGGRPATVYDFATYFNAFSNAKWRTYTVIDNVSLRLVAKGSFEVVLTAYEYTHAKPRRVVLERRTFSFDDGFSAVDIAYPASDAVLLSFEIVAEDPVELKEAYYYTRLDEASVRPVELAVAMTTIGKEEYVLANIRQFEEAILSADDDLAHHLNVHIVDNGRTLDAAALGNDRIHVHPNPNVGGSGGFTRGMIEAMEQDVTPTHVLLMDDDVQISPESVRRTYTLLSLLKDEYAGAFVSGAMLSLERPDEFYEDTGYVAPDGAFRPAKVPMQDFKPWLEGTKRYCIADLEDVMQLETVENRNAHAYAAWWYCCIPMTAIRTYGLPLPLFIRGDDAEYANRAAHGFITMNGICIWHMAFALKFRAALERYQTIRNDLIAQATTGVYDGVDFLTRHYTHVSMDLKTFNYNSAELGIMAIEDFLKGPEYLKRVNADALFKRVMAMNETLVPIDQIADPRVRGIDINPATLYHLQERNLMTRLLDFTTYNGQRGPKRLAKGGVGIIPFDGWHYPANDIRGKDALLVVTTDGTEGILREKDRSRFAELNKRYEAAMKEYRARKDEVCAAWRAARDELTSVEFWKWYLEDQTQQGRACDA